jgi:hypothetical protein
MPDSSDNVKRLPVEFYRSEKGIEPVRDWLKSLDNLDKTKIGQAVKMLEYGWPVGMPTCRPLRRGKSMTNNSYIGSSFDNFLAEEGILEDCTQFATDKVLEWQESNKNKVLQISNCEKK